MAQGWFGRFAQYEGRFMERTPGMLINRRLPATPEEVADRVHLNDSGTGYRVGETETAFIEVVPMLFNDRVIVVPKSAPLTVDRHWCFQRGPAAILAALAWDGSDDTEPVGWIKSWDGRYSEEFLSEQKRVTGRASA